MATKEVKIIKPIVANANNNLIRMAAYCRVSTDSADQVNSFMAQMAYYSEYIDSHDNMTLVDIYADEGITGTSINKREDFKRLIKDCQNRKIDRVIVKSVQRFARNSLECIETVRLLSECGVSVYFETDNIDTKSMNNEMFLYIKSAFAQGESLSASKRVSTSIRMRMKTVHTLLLTLRMDISLKTEHWLSTKPRRLSLDRSSIGIFRVWESIVSQPGSRKRTPIYGTHPVSVIYLLMKSI